MPTFRIAFSWFVLLMVLWICPPGHSFADNRAVLLEIDGPIGPATKDYFHRALEKAKSQKAQLVLIRMDTPGGLDFSMRDIIQEILVSSVPVVTYVAPSGARAASAGTYILYASHVAAMAPATNLGAATPVQIGGMPKPPMPDKGKVPVTEEPTEPGTAMERKVINDAVAYIKGLAKMRGRNEEWAEKAVREAASLPAEDALALGVIDLVADDVGDLLEQLNGREVSVLGQSITINTAGVMVESLAPDWRSKLLAIITNPNVAYILMLIGIYGLIFEFSNPGAFVPGVTGAICLLLAMYAFQVLPVNYAGFALMLLGIALMVAEAFAPSFGALGLGGVIAFVFGSIILMDTDVPGYGVSLPLIAAFALFSSVLFTIVLVLALKARRRPVVSGQEEMVGAVAIVLNDFDVSGRVRVHSEIWSAKTNQPLTKGQRVRVVSVDGLVLTIEPDTVSEHTAQLS